MAVAAAVAAAANNSIFQSKPPGSVGLEEAFVFSVILVDRSLSAAFCILPQSLAHAEK